MMKKSKPASAAKNAKVAPTSIAHYLSQVEQSHQKHVDACHKKVEQLKASIAKGKAKLQAVSAKKSVTKTKHATKKTTATKSLHNTALKAHHAAINAHNDLKHQFELAKLELDVACKALKKHSGLTKVIEQFHAKWDKKESQQAKKKAKSAHKTAPKKAKAIEALPASKSIAKPKNTKIKLAQKRVASLDKPSKLKKHADSLRNRTRVNETHHSVGLSP